MKAGIRSKLLKIYSECCKLDWDSYEAEPLSWETCLLAEKLVGLFSLFLPVPDIVPEPTGSIGLEWYIGKRKEFSISFEAREEEISYAGLFEEREICGQFNLKKLIYLLEFFGEISSQK